MYSDKEAAALYNVLNPWGPSDDFYLELVMAAKSVVDIGCGTGTLLHEARKSRHTGRLCGVDPDAASLDVARRQSDIEWVLGTAASMTWDSSFDLATMTGHAFQSLVTDEDIRSSLTAINKALTAGGRFAFETRNPAIREWEQWNPSNGIDAVDPSEQHVRVSYEVESVVGDVVMLSETTTAADGRSRVNRASLRFLDVEALGGFLTAANFEIEAEYGDWEREPVTGDSPEIVTIATPRK